MTESWFVFDQYHLVHGFHEPGALGWTLINFMARLGRDCAIQTHQMVHQLAVPYPPCTMQHPSMDPVSLHLYACVCLHLKKTLILLFMIILHDRLLRKPGVAEAQTVLLWRSGGCHYGNKLYYSAVLLPCVQLQSYEPCLCCSLFTAYFIVHFIWDVSLLLCWNTFLFAFIILLFCVLLDKCVVEHVAACCSRQNTT